MLGKKGWGGGELQHTGDNSVGLGWKGLSGGRLAKGGFCSLAAAALLEPGLSLAKEFPQ